MSGARLFAAFLSLAGLAAISASAQAQPKRVLIIGDSLSAGYNLPEGTSFPWALNRRLHMRGHRDVAVLDATEMGDTTGDALERLPKAFAYGADAVIVELGGNDMLQREDPSVVYRNLDAIVRYSKARGSRVILAGMLSYPRRRDPTYKLRFDWVYPTLAAQQKVALYPFFLDGVYGNPALIQDDNKHPNVLGSDYIAARMTPMVERTLQAPERRRYHAWR
ncbi:arylesterase [Methylocystis sp. MJC1]|jgi:acyl-CoA thioesterase-1|uniref:arylesterase n=1 Tax=Methylocystis sp. MJC1 TaxID=2654282 RepID=UPI0013ED66F3|nr:arylesterase [Methylocystis sp. MJC1]KAF2991870.1 Arylesterase [Methylocystis sp. MJC1]MBU6528973.1 arylesterase [Methylocystis sp. MJC1]UZX11854.1 arylesterase [Methylocystis sp. MJC1]